MVKCRPEAGKIYHLEVSTGTVCMTYRSSYIPTLLLDVGL
jgi:hypothetical protein